MKICIMVEYQDYRYESDIENVNNAELKQIEQTIEETLSSDAPCLRIKINNNIKYFGADILRKSVITIVKL